MWLLAGLPLLLAARPCSTSWDCALNGACVKNVCMCDAGWGGGACSKLQLVPLSPKALETGAYRHFTANDGRKTSWGASALYEPQDGLWHLFVSELKSNCTLTSWIPASQITHATSTLPQGPYQFKETLFDTFHHNPRLTRANDGTYLLYMIGGDVPAPAPCRALPPELGEQLDTRILVSSAPTLNGPWSNPQGPLLARGGPGTWDYVVTNPTPLILPNGTTLLYYRGTPKYWGGATSQTRRRRQLVDLPESIGLAVAPHWAGPFRKLGKAPVLATMNEDPFVWQDARGFHMLTHGRDDWWNTHLAWSLDGLTWSDGSAVAANTSVALSDGTVYSFTNRERPYLLLNQTTQRPALLFNGVCPEDKYTYGYTLAQFLVQ